MAKHLPDPPGQPDPAARRVIDAIHTYRDDPDRDPVVTTAGLRHIYHAAELAWDHSVAHAKTAATYAAIRQATGDSLGTLQGRIRAHQHRTRGQAIRQPIDPRRQS